MAFLNSTPENDTSFSLNPFRFPVGNPDRLIEIVKIIEAEGGQIDNVRIATLPSSLGMGPSAAKTSSRNLELSDPISSSRDGTFPRFQLPGWHIDGDILELRENERRV